MAYCQLQKEETQVQIKASAKQFYDLYCNRPQHIAKMCPEFVKSVEILKGEWGSEGSITSWNYIHEGKVFTCKALLEGIEKENNKAILKIIEGDVLKLYKNYRTVLQVTPQEKGSIVHWTLEYENETGHVPETQAWLQMTIKTTKDIDAHLTN